MNIQQLEYAVAVDIYRNFTKAADVCCVTQPTLSMMLNKLEEELGIKIFDRTKNPVKPTRAGTKLIAQAHIILREVARLKEITKEEKGEIGGKLHIGVIPTLAPYLLPLFLKDFMDAFVGKDKKFTQPVLVLTSGESDLHMVGFVTKNDLSEWGLTDMVAVYFPHSYNFSGNVYIVSKDLVKPINASPSDVMKFVVTGGVAGIH